MCNFPKFLKKFVSINCYKTERKNDIFLLGEENIKYQPWQHNYFLSIRQHIIAQHNAWPRNGRVAQFVLLEEANVHLGRSRNKTIGFMNYYYVKITQILFFWLVNYVVYNRELWSLLYSYCLLWVLVEQQNKTKQNNCVSLDYNSNIRSYSWTKFWCYQYRISISPSK